MVNRMYYNDIEIAQMTINDFESIKDILISDFDDFWNLDIMKEELQSENSHYFVARIDNKIVGFAGIKVILDEADVMNIVTRKDSRKHGVGSSLLNAIIIYATNSGIEKLTLEVNEQNTTAIHLYEKFGFNKIALRKNYYNNIDTAIIMQLMLTKKS